MAEDHDESSSRRYNPLINPFHTKPVWVDGQEHLFFQSPLLGALLFENTASDARDNCANERTFLSWVRLSMYLAVVSVAIIISFHFRGEPTLLERRMALPLGLIFWVLSLICLANGFGNYVYTVRKYSHKAALVQSGWKTQAVVVILAIVILASCILFIVVDAGVR